MKPLLFLDVDGVINKKDNFNPSKNPGPYPLDSYCAFLVGKIKLETGCDVVLSSAWRYNPEAVKHINDRVVNLIGITPTNLETMSQVTERGDEINAWLAEHPEYTKYAILDDESDFYDDQPLFQTTFEEGLTDEIALAVIEHLGRRPTALR